MDLVFLLIAVILLTGLLFGKLARVFKMPNVTGYLVGGVVLIILFKLLNVYDFFESYKVGLELIPTIALSFIAFSIGTEFNFSYFKIVGTKPIIIAICEAFGATLVVLASLLIIHFINPEIISIQVALMLSAIASATAPAATIMVIKQYKAKGEVTQNLLSVVAIDDAVALTLFGIVFAIATSINKNVGATSVAWTIIKPFIEVVASLGLGFIIGILMTLLLRMFKGRGNRLCVIIVGLLVLSSSSAFVTEVIKIDFSLSTLLACMMAGAVFTNTNDEEKVTLVMELVDRFTPPLLIMFFVISGADLELSSISKVGLIGIIYVVTRVIGKVLGARMGATVTQSSKEVKKYLGWALVPQAGVAIGLSAVAVKALGANDPNAEAIRTIVLCATLIYELIGPFVAKKALKGAGEISKEA